MSNIIDPRTGMPTTPTTRQISETDLIKVLQSHRVKIDLLNQQNMQLGLYIEFILEHLLAITDAEGNPLVQIDVSKFQAFAEKRLLEIQNEMIVQQSQVEAQTAQSVLEQVPEQMMPEIQLNE